VSGCSGTSRSAGSGYFVGDGDGLCEGLGEGLGEGLVVIALLATGLLDVPMTVVLTGLGPWFAKYRATGTTMMPTITVRTNVTAPHSRRINWAFTSREL
jgi:hypothetical protein